MNLNEIEFIKTFGCSPSVLKEGNLFSEKDFQEDRENYVLSEGKEYTRKDDSSLDDKYQYIIEERNIHANSTRKEE